MLKEMSKARLGKMPVKQSHTEKRSASKGLPDILSLNLTSIFQYIIMAALLVFIIIMLAQGNSREVDIEEIEAAMKQNKTIAALEQKSLGDSAKTFSIDNTMLDEGIYFSTDDVMDVNELFIARIPDTNNRQAVIDAIEKYLEDKTSAFDGYGTDQFDLLSAAIITEKGDYVFFGVSKDVVEWESEFLGAIG